MSGGHIPQDEYHPKGATASWIEHRLPLGGLVHHLGAFPTPKNLNWMWIFGAVLAVFLVIQIITGVLLAMHYTPQVEMAFSSVESIMRDVNSGWWLRYIHANGASFFFIAVYLHIFRGLYYGSYKAPREILWIIGVLIYLLMMATAFMGYVLPWGQMSFWGATVITGLFSAIPVVGDNLLIWLQGGFSVDNAALNRFFALHYLLPFAIAGLVALHIWALHHVGNNNPTGVPVRTDSRENVKRDTVPFSPFYTVKDGVGLIAILIIFASVVHFIPNWLGHPDNYIEANSQSTPAHIVPEWYFLPFYAILRSIDNKLLGVLAMFSAIGVLALLPWLDTSRVRSGAYRPAFKQFFWMFAVTCLILGYVGSKTPDDPVVDALSFQTVEHFHGVNGAEEAEAYRNSVIEAARAAYISNNGDEEGFIAPALSLERAPVVRADGGAETEWIVTETHYAFTYKALGVIMTIYYFAYFLLILPILGLVERARPRPESIDASMMASKAGADDVVAAE